MKKNERIEKNESVEKLKGFKSIKRNNETNFISYDDGFNIHSFR